MVGFLALTLSAQPARAVVRLSLQGASGAPGDTVVVGARMTTDGEAVAGMQADLNLDPNVGAVVAAKGVPDCSVGAGLDKGASAFAFAPAGCDSGRQQCAGVRALIFAVDNVDPMPSGADLFACRVAITANAAPGAARLDASSALYAPPQGGDRRAAVESGLIEVKGAAVAGGTAGGGGCQLRAAGSRFEGWIILAGAVLLALPRRRRKVTRPRWGR